MICGSCRKDKLKLNRGPNETWVCGNKECCMYTDYKKVTTWVVDNKLKNKL